VGYPDRRRRTSRRYSPLTPREEKPAPCRRLPWCRRSRSPLSCFPGLSHFGEGVEIRVSHPRTEMHSRQTLGGASILLESHEQALASLQYRASHDTVAEVDGFDVGMVCGGLVSIEQHLNNEAVHGVDGRWFRIWNKIAVYLLRPSCDACYTVRRPRARPSSPVRAWAWRGCVVGSSRALGRNPESVAPTGGAGEREHRAPKTKWKVDQVDFRLWRQLLRSRRDSSSD
jgi:hypothetical protein